MRRPSMKQKIRQRHINLWRLNQPMEVEQTPTPPEVSMNPKNEGSRMNLLFKRVIFRLNKKNLSLLQVRDRIKLNFQTNKQEITAGD